MAKKLATREEFEQGYAERSGVTVEYLHSLGEFGVPCDCDEYPACQGWKLMRAHLLEEDELLTLPSDLQKKARELKAAYWGERG